MFFCAKSVSAALLRSRKSSAAKKILYKNDYILAEIFVMLYNIIKAFLFLPPSGGQGYAK